MKDHTMKQSINRRNFMKMTGSGLGMVAALGGGEPIAAESNKIPEAKTGMKLGMVTYNMGKDMSCEELVSLCRKTGLEGVELRTSHAHGVEISMSSEERSKVRKTFRDSGIEIAGIGTACEFHSNENEKVSKQVQEAIAYAKLAADVGAPSIKVRPNGIPDGEDTAKVLERIGKAWGQVASAASDLGIEVRMEVHGAEETRSLANIRKMLEYAGKPNAKVCWNSNGGEEDANGSIKTNFDLVKHAIGQVHITEIGVYQYPWQELFSLLKEMNFTGYCLAEIPYNPEPERFMRYYRTLFDLYTGNYTYPNPKIYLDK